VISALLDLLGLLGCSLAGGCRHAGPAAALPSPLEATLPPSAVSGAGRIEGVGCSPGLHPDGQGDCLDAVALRKRAATRTNDAKAALVHAAEIADADEQIDLLEKSSAGYDRAASDWAALAAAERSPDSLYWLADAQEKAVRTIALLHRTRPEGHPAPTRERVDAALAAARDAREANIAAPQLHEYAAIFFVEVTDVARDLALQGERVREAPRVEGQTVVVEPLPDAVERSIRARDDFVRLVPRTEDERDLAGEYMMYGADMFFVRGQLAEARRRYEALIADRCERDGFGFGAWVKLVTIAKLEREPARLRALAARTCAQDDEQRARAAALLKK
jgi:hypothetical protein